MQPTWRGRPVVLTWEARFPTPRVAWVHQLHDAIAASDALGESETQLGARLNALALDEGAYVALALDDAWDRVLNIRLVAPRISYVRGAQPRRVFGPAVVELIGGSCGGERTEVGVLADALDCGGSSYRRSFHCAIDGTVRYVLESTPG